MTKFDGGVQEVPKPSSNPTTRPELNWPELAASSRYVRRNGWEYRPIPEELSRLPENIQVPEKLQQILTWSLIQGSNWSFERPEKPTVDPRATPIPATFKEQNDRLVGAVEIEKEPQESSADNISTSSYNTTFTQAVSSVRGQSPDSEKSLKSRLLSKIKLSRSEDRSSATVSKDVNSAVECTCCFDELPESEMIRLKSCQHWYCKGCLSTLIATAMSTEASFPPKCCLSPIPLKQILKALNTEQREEYQKKAAEYAEPTSDRWYCPNKECLKWIPRSRLKINKDLGYDCPHCSSKLCRTCRGDAHPKNIECPQDFGLEAMLETAEIEGWQRCYKCRALVEHNKGCRHMTCRCGGQFCYVCGTRWQTCNCTETDAANKRAGAKRRRDERNAKVDAEAAEIARAIAEVEEMERREAEERRLEEERRQRQEEEQLHRLEIERQAEELRRQVEAEQAERDLRRALIASFEEDWDALEEVYYKITAFQSAELTLRHEVEDKRLGTMRVKDEENAKAGFDKFTQILTNNSDKRRNMLRERHATDLTALDARQEEEEDDMFLQVQMRLRGKANKESRMERMLNEIHKQQDEEKEELAIQQKAEIERLDVTIKADSEGVQRWYESQLCNAECKQTAALQRFGYTVGADRQYFEIVVERRNKMLAQHCSRSICSIEQGDEPYGLTEFEASRIQPSLPELDDGEPGPSGISRGPTVIMTPHGPLTMASRFYQQNNSSVSQGQAQSSPVADCGGDDSYRSGQQTPTPSRTRHQFSIPGAFPTDFLPISEQPVPPAPRAQPPPPPLFAATPMDTLHRPVPTPTKLTIPTTTTSASTPRNINPHYANNGNANMTHAPDPNSRTRHPNTTHILHPQPLQSYAQPTAAMATLAASVALALGPQPVSRVSSPFQPQPQPRLQQQNLKSPITSITTVDQEADAEELRTSDVPPMSAGAIKRNRWKFKRSKDITEEEIKRRMRGTVGDASFRGLGPVDFMAI